MSDDQIIEQPDVSSVPALGLEELLPARAALNEQIAALQAANPAFAPGDRVGVSHDVAIFAPESVLRRSALPEDAQVGTIKDFANDERSWFTVELESGDEKVFTADELVRISRVGD